MNPTQLKRPPILPTWFLEHFGCSADNAAVLGDLEERYQQGQSAVWYWKQSLIAVIVSAFDQVRRNVWLTFRAVLVGWIGFSYLLVPTTGVIAKGILDIYRGSEASSWNTAAVSVFRYAVIGLFIFTGLGMGIVTGWIVARLHRRQRAPILLIAVLIPISFVSGNPEGIGSFVFWTGVAALTVGILVGGLSTRELPSGPSSSG